MTRSDDTQQASGTLQDDLRTLAQGIDAALTDDSAERFPRVTVTIDDLSKLADQLMTAVLIAGQGPRCEAAAPGLWKSAGELAGLGTVRSTRLSLALGLMAIVEQPDALQRTARYLGGRLWDDVNISDFIKDEEVLVRMLPAAAALLREREEHTPA